MRDTDLQMIDGPTLMAGPGQDDDAGTGLGVAIAANKVPGIRAALIWSETTAALAREHNDAQIAAVGGRQHEKEEALQIIRVFLSTPFSGDERHVRRIGQIGEYERTGGIAGSVLDADA